MVINTLSLDPQSYGHDSELARERYARLRRPFAFPLDDEHASRVGLPGNSLAVVTRESADPPDTRAVYVVRCAGRLEPVRGTALAGRRHPRRAASRRAVHRPRRCAPPSSGRIDLVLPDVRL